MEEKRKSSSEALETATEREASENGAATIKKVESKMRSAEQSSTTLSSFSSTLKNRLSGGSARAPGARPGSIAALAKHAPPAR